jgi:ketosteroid isomerase-like protein
MQIENSQIEQETEIRNLIEQQINAVRNKNIDEALIHYHNDVLSFDVVDPLQFKGKDAIRKRLEEWFATFEGPIKNEIAELKIEVSENIALCSRLNHVNALKIDGEKLDMWWRETTCFKRIDGHWMIIHVHSSVPFNPQDGKASTGLNPES